MRYNRPLDRVLWRLGNSHQSPLLLQLVPVVGFRPHDTHCFAGPQMAASVSFSR